jgi:hypothetical protein
MIASVKGARECMPGFTLAGLVNAMAMPAEHRAVGLGQGISRRNLVTGQRHTNHPLRSRHGGFRKRITPHLPQSEDARLLTLAGNTLPSRLILPSETVTVTPIVWKFVKRFTTELPSLFQRLPEQSIVPFLCRLNFLEEFISTRSACIHSNLLFACSSGLWPSASCSRAISLQERQRILSQLK